jgi:hypothetical protein
MQHGGDPGSLAALGALRRLKSLRLKSLSRISLSRYHARRDVTHSRGVTCRCSLGPLAGSYRSRDIVVCSE